MFKNISITKKLIFSYLSLGVFALVLVSFIFYSAFKKALIERTSAQLASVNILKEVQIADYLANKKEIYTLTSNHNLKDILKGGVLNEEGDFFLKEFAMEHEYNHILFYDTTLQLRKEFNRHPRDHDSLFTTATFLRFLKESFQHSHLADFTVPLRSSSPEVYMGIPVSDRTGKKLGVMVFNKAGDKIRYILQENSGMGNTGETYIVGEDLRMRTNSRFFPDKTPYTILVNTPSPKRAFKGEKGVTMINDYRNKPVLSAFSNIKTGDLHWAIISEIDEDEAMEPVYKVRNYIWMVCLFIFTLIVIVTVFISEKISRPIKYLRALLSELSKGILPDKITRSGSRDETGEMMEAMIELVDALKRTTVFAYEIGAGNFPEKFQPLSDKDELGMALIQMRDKLRALKEQEQHFIRERSAALLEGQEQERKRVARELHDGIGQMLTVIKLRMNLLEEDSEEKDELKKLVDETITEVKRISFNLMPNVLVDFGLDAALRNLTDSLEKSTGIKFIYEIDSGSPKRINFETGITMYRIAQEALNNCIKYSHANRIEVRLFFDESKAVLEVKDNGEGFDLSNASVRFSGIKNMEERSRILNGTFSIKSEKNNGTVITVEIPITHE